MISYKKQYCKEWHKNHTEEDRAYQRFYYRKNIISQRIYYREYYRKNKDRINFLNKKEHNKQWKEKHEEYNKRYREKHEEYIKQYNKQYNKQYREKHKEYFKQYNKQWRKEHPEAGKEWYHKNGISKTYRDESYGTKTGISYTKDYKKKYSKIYKHSRRKAGKLTIKTIQQVYEDNIKKYGTLTCYLCYIAIQFGDDSLDHKIPISRRNDFPKIKINSKENLDIAHRNCNSKKNNKTEKEYRNWLILQTERG